jgi:hypothetical protein
VDEVKFRVQGSAEQPYEVHFINHGDGNLSAYCTCPAGENGQYCKHRFSIIDGKTKGIVSDNAEHVAVVVSWIPGSDIEAALRVVREAESEAAAAKKRVSQAKKDLARAMRD